MNSTNAAQKNSKPTLEMGMMAMVMCRQIQAAAVEDKV
jgi:hypothetical protein